MPKFTKLLYSNKILGALLILIQLIIIGAVFFWLTDYAQYIYVFAVILSAVLIVYEVNRQEESGFKLTWIMLIAVIPIFGAVFYLFLHYNQVGRKILKNSGTIRECTDPYTELDEETANALCGEFPEEMGIMRYVYEQSHFPVYCNSSVRYYPLGDDMFEGIKEELNKAEKFIFIEMFIINPAGRMWPEILEILKKKAKSGVEVRLMYDGMGCLTLLKSDYPDIMESYNIKCRIFSPIVPLFSTYQNNRDHRKIIIVDGKTAFTGGVNFADEYINERKRFGHWKDNGVKITGDAARGFTAMFLQMWNTYAARIGLDNYGNYLIAEASVRGKGYIIPFADSPNTVDRFGEKMYINILNSAREYVYIMTPYLVLGTEMLGALKFAAKRGVDVRIILPHIPDKPYAFWLAGTYYTELISAGIKIYEYTPGFVHAKMSVSDGKRAVIGTINHDYRSLYLNHECASYMVGVPEIKDMETDFKKTLEKCESISIEEYKSRGAFKRVLGHIIRLIAPLL